MHLLHTITPRLVKVVEYPGNNHIHKQVINKSITASLNIKASTLIDPVIRLSDVKVSAQSEVNAITNIAISLANVRRIGSARQMMISSSAVILHLQMIRHPTTLTDLFAFSVHEWYRYDLRDVFIVGVM